MQSTHAVSAREPGAQTERLTTPAPADRPRKWTVTTTTGFAASGPLPSWTAEDPSESGVEPEHLAGFLDDLTFWAPFDGQPVQVSIPAYMRRSHTPAVVSDELLRGCINSHPYRKGDEGAPVAHVEVIEDVWIENLDPQGVAALVAKLRAQADRLEQVCGQLVAARAEWAAEKG
jgi:hypothetical protein